jgi:sugar phosphate isomerase/epimerase
MKCSFNRRRFLQASLLGSTALTSALPAKLFAGPVKAARDPFDGLELGMASYSLRKFNLDQAIAMTKEAGVKYLCLKDVHLSLKSTPAECQEARNKIQDAGLVVAGGGVIYMKNNEAEIRAVFEYAKNAGMPTVVCSPDVNALDTVEKMAMQYDLIVAIHNHGPTDDKYPSPRDVLRLVKDRDQRMGICMDVGHTVRIGEDPVAVIEECTSRLYDFHLKDVTAPTKAGVSIEVGKGVIDIVGVLRTLVKLKYSHHINLEYEATPDAPMPGILASYAYIRGVLAAT